MAPNLVLDLFPGIGLLARAFEAEGYCVVSGPDLIFGGDVRTFSPPGMVFEGVIGGPPCQAFSRLSNLIRAKGLPLKPNLIPEFERIVREARPAWFLMENVELAPEPVVPGYAVTSMVVQNRWFGAEQSRTRRISFGAADGRRLDVSPDVVLFENPRHEWAVVASSAKAGAQAKSRTQLMDDVERRTGKRSGGGTGAYPRRSVARCAELQGLPPDFLADAPFTVEGKYRVIGNGVPLPMGRAIARAVRRAMSAG